MVSERSPFKNGYWMWDDTSDCLAFVSREKENKERIFSTGGTAAKAPASKKADSGIEFRETVDNLEQAKFRRYFQRRVKPNEPEVITIQDLKDVVLFLANPQNILPEFITYFHLPTTDKFLRALIVYFTYYIQVWDNIMSRRIEAKRKLRQPVVTVLEDVVRDNLADLRSMVAKEYARILMGLEDMQKFYHMSSKNNTSLSDKDRRLLEALMVMSVRVVWIAMQRKYLNLIEKETNRLLRTDIFSASEHSNVKTTAFDTTLSEDRVLLGKAFVVERKLKHRSPCAQELIFDDHDHRMLAIGILEIEPRDERQNYLEACYAAPEECLLDMNIGIGILGIPRDDLDPMMKPKQRTKARTETKPPRVIPDFRIPPKTDHKDLLLAEVLPSKPCQYTETEQTKLARNQQHIRWRKHVLHATSEDESGDTEALLAQ